MGSEVETQPVLADLEAERDRLRGLEERLAREWTRLRSEAAAEIDSMKDALRDAAQRASRRERELQRLREELERRLEHGDAAGVLDRISDRRMRRGDGSERRAHEELVRGEAAVSRQLQELELRARSVAETEARRAEELAEVHAALGERERAVVAVEADRKSTRLNPSH